MGYKIYNIAKPNGGTRTISEPDEQTTALSLEMKTRFDAWLEEIKWDICALANFSWAYTPGKSINNLIENVYTFLGDEKEYDIFYLDVKNFFGEITLETHIDKLVQTIYDAVNLSNRGSDHLDINLPELNEETIWDLLHPKELGTKGISQGNPLSPLIANMVGTCYIDWLFLSSLLNHVDDGVKIFYARYSDNIYIIHKRVKDYSRDAFFKKLQNIADDVLKYNGFELSLKVKGSHQRNVILGVRLGATKGQLKDKNWLRSLFYRIDKKGPAILRDEDIIKRFGRIKNYDIFIDKVKGLINYILSIDPTMEGYIMEHVPEIIVPKEIKEIANAEGWQALQQEEQDSNFG